MSLTIFWLDNVNSIQDVASSSTVDLWHMQKTWDMDFSTQGQPNSTIIDPGFQGEVASRPLELNVNADWDRWDDHTNAS